ncbi:unnamed protein product [Dibothriocephalus latus]|uniref:Uncharacterized protein n=1 Tax=Dibothriocephalus latus TaxID=60516 RepID=A0A3P7LR92_DIBLA|nr:unnamed protein product [Dibothriocephalus latus]
MHANKKDNKGLYPIEEDLNFTGSVEDAWGNLLMAITNKDAIDFNDVYCRRNVTFIITLPDVNLTAKKLHKIKLQTFDCSEETLIMAAKGQIMRNQKLCRSEDVAAREKLQGEENYKHFLRQTTCTIIKQNVTWTRGAEFNFSVDGEDDTIYLVQCTLFDCTWSFKVIKKLTPQQIKTGCEFDSLERWIRARMLVVGLPTHQSTGELRRHDWRHVLKQTYLVKSCTLSNQHYTKASRPRCGGPPRPAREILPIPKPVFILGGVLSGCFLFFTEELKALINKAGHNSYADDPQVLLAYTVFLEEYTEEKHERLKRFVSAYLECRQGFKSCPENAKSERLFERIQMHPKNAAPENVDRKIQKAMKSQKPDVIALYLFAVGYAEFQQGPGSHGDIGGVSVI